jgi:uncharacterized protein (DUF4415 family)
VDFEWDEDKAASNIQKHSHYFRAPRHAVRAEDLREEPAMKREYDFSRAKRGPIVPPARGKTRITIRIDDDVLDWFRTRVHQQGGGNYQTLINSALREQMARNEDFLAESLRRVIREEVAPYIATPKRRSGK